MTEPDRAEPGLTPLTAEEIKDIRREHRRQEVATPDDHVDTVCGRCYMFDEGWPCDTIRLADALDAATPRPRLAEALRKYGARHLADCRASILGPDPTCTCGLSAALASGTGEPGLVR